MRVFIDGQHGTTGLQLLQRLQAGGWELLSIEPEWRKDRARRLELYSQAEVVVLCLPDDEAGEMARLAQDFPCRLLDASSVHRCHEDWIYGLPELESQQPARIAGARKVSNPGCYASAVILLLKPLIVAGLLSAEASLAIYGFSGYSGGGRQLIERCQSEWRAVPLMLYGLDFNHKHLPEMLRWSGLQRKPLFLPAVIDCPQGMLVSIALQREQCGADASTLRGCYQDYYRGAEAVEVWESPPLVEGRYLQLSGWAGKDHCALAVLGAGEHLLLLALLDNLGKGASGVALQNLRLMREGGLR